MNSSSRYSNRFWIIRSSTPVMIIIMAVIVGAIMIGVILPIYQSYSTIGAGM